MSRGHEDTYNSGDKRPNSKLREKDLLSFAWMIADGMSYLAAMKVSNGNRTEWSPIRSVIIRVITKYLFITSMIKDRIGRHEDLLPINHKNYNFREKKNTKV